MTRPDMTNLMAYIEKGNEDFTDLIAQKKPDIWQIKNERLMTTSHMIKHGRSKHVQTLVKQIEQENKNKKTDIILLSKCTELSNNKYLHYKWFVIIKHY